MTQEGRAFLQASKEILKAYDGLGDRLRELEHVVAGPLKIAAIYSVGLHDLPPYLKKYRALYPDVNLEIEYRRSTQIYSEVLDGTADRAHLAAGQRPAPAAAEGDPCRRTVPGGAGAYPGHHPWQR